MSMADMTDGFVKNTESTFGKPNPSRDTVRAARRVVVKVQLHCALIVVRRWNRNRGDTAGRLQSAREAPRTGSSSCRQTGMRQATWRPQTPGGQP